MSSVVDMSEDSQGVPTLFLRGEWSDDVERALASSDWEALAILGVEWSSYECLLPFANKIRRIRVPFGPDSSAGFLDLTELEVIECTDVLKPAVDFRVFPKLKHLEALWNKRNPLYFANEAMSFLVLHGVGGPDLTWIPDSQRLRHVELRGGGLRSLQGIERASEIVELRAVELKHCLDVTAVTSLHAIRTLSLDAPKAALDDLEWVGGMPALTELMLSTPTNHIDWALLGRHKTLTEIAITAPEGYAASDGQIVGELESEGRTIQSFQRFNARRPSFSVILSGEGPGTISSSGMQGV